MKFDNNWNNRILVVDDKPDIHRDIEEILKPSTVSPITSELFKSFDAEFETAFLPDFEILHAMNGEEAREMVLNFQRMRRPIAVAFVDMVMPGWDGVETVRKIREFDKDIEFVIMTAYPNKPLSEIIYDMELLNKLLYIRKPFSREEFQQMCISLVEKWNVERELVISNERLESLVNSIGDAIGMFDESWRLTYANKNFMALFNLNRENFYGKSIEDMMRYLKQRITDPEGFESAIESFLSDPKTVFEYIVETTRPIQRVLLVRTVPVYDRQKDNGLIGQVIIFHDITNEDLAEQLKKEVVELRADLGRRYSLKESDKIIGNSKAMKEVLTMIQQAAQSNITVLITGESGTGKELIAKAIHYNSPRKNGPFVPVNCAAIPETLIESELFGHEKGAFTGAGSRRIGKFEQANGGTILLDEIAEMSPSIQPKLLRVLQDKQICRVGSNTLVPVDVRIIAATNKRLENAVKDGRFREDLYYRILGLHIHVPPLRERREDIPLLAMHFFKRAVEQNNKQIKTIAGATMELLVNYDWPGNVRQLENVIESAVLIEQTDVLLPDSLSIEIRKSYRPEDEFAEKNDRNQTDEEEILTLREAEKREIIKALRLSDFNIQKAARALGINRATLYRKIRMYDIKLQ